jgi:hypothetical protein
MNGTKENSLQPVRSDLGQKQRDSEAHRHGDQHRDGGAGQRAVDRDEGSEVTADRVPLVADDEAPAERLERQAPAPQHRQRGPGQDEQHQRGRAEQHPAEQGVLPCFGCRAIARARRFDIEPG